MSSLKSHKKQPTAKAGNPIAAAPIAPAAAAMLHALPDAVLAIAGNVITYANHAAMESLGLGEKSLMGHGVDVVFGAAHPVCAAAAAGAAGGQNIILRDIDLRHHMAARLSFSALPDNAQTILGQTVLVSWTVDRVTLQSEWLTQQRTVVKPAQHIAHVLAHEIKNPLAGIRGAAQLLQKSVSGDDDLALASLIDVESQRILRLLTRVNAFDDVVSPEKFMPVNLHSVTDHVIDCARAGFGSGCTLRAVYDPSLPEIEGHADTLVQAVMNLAKNAAEANAKTITLRTSFDVSPQYHPETGRKLPLILSIEDDGAGMSDETAARLFEPCYSTKPEGEGLGLVVVSRIIDGHGGMLDVSRSENRTVFRLAFPLAPRRKEKNA